MTFNRAISVHCGVRKSFKLASFRRILEMFNWDLQTLFFWNEKHELKAELNCHVKIVLKVMH